MKPRLLFLRGSSAGLPGYVRTHLDEQVRCLEQWFEVVVAEGSVDYAELVERVEPDATMLESGVYAHGRTLHHADAHRDVPRLGFLHADAYCASRSTALADFARWGVEDVVTTSVAMAGYTPVLAEQLLTWPNFVDPALHHDRRLRKHVPVLLTGSHGTHYPWRVAVAREVGRSALSSRRTPHLGWFDARADGGMVTGVDYARLLGSAWLVPACGTIAHELVRKQLEAPACGALLVAEPTVALHAAGFRDGVSCVLSDPDTAVARMAELLDDPDELRRMVTQGHDLVHERHTMAARSQVHDWYLLRLRGVVGPLAQDGPFGRVRQRWDGGPAPSGAAPARDRVLLAAARDELDAGRAGHAERLAHRALSFHPALEPLGLLARCRLWQGDPVGAAEHAVRGVRHATDVLGSEPDPVLWALLVRAELAAGRLRRAHLLARQQPRLRHPELDRIRDVVAGLTGVPAPEDPSALARPSIVEPGPADEEAWLAELVEDLEAAGHARLAAHVVRRTRPLAARLCRRARPGARAPRLRPWVRTARRRWSAPLTAALVRWAGERGRVLAELVRTEQPDRLVVVGGGSVAVRTAVLRAADGSPHVAEVAWVHPGREPLPATGASERVLVVVLGHRLARRSAVADLLATATCGCVVPRRGRPQVSHRASAPTRSRSNAVVG